MYLWLYQHVPRLCIFDLHSMYLSFNLPVLYQYSGQDTSSTNPRQDSNQNQKSSQSAPLRCWILVHNKFPESIIRCKTSRQFITKLNVQFSTQNIWYQAAWYAWMLSFPISECIKFMQLKNNCIICRLSSPSHLDIKFHNAYYPVVAILSHN